MACTCHQRRGLFNFESMKIYKRHLTSNGLTHYWLFRKRDTAKKQRGLGLFAPAFLQKINFYTQKRERFYKAWLFSSRKARPSVCALTGKLFRLKPSMIFQYSTLHACIAYA